MAEITKDMTVSDILAIYPDAYNILINMGMYCITCPAAQMESLEEAAYVHGLDPDMIMREINASMA